MTTRPTQRELERRVSALEQYRAETATEPAIELPAVPLTDGLTLDDVAKQTTLPDGYATLVIMPMPEPEPDKHGVTPEYTPQALRFAFAAPRMSRKGW